MTKRYFDILTKKNYHNIHQLPKLQSIVLNMGLKDVITNKYSLLAAIFTLQLICGKKPLVTKAKSSISSFKLRKGMLLGLKVILRGKQAYKFLKKLNLIVLSSDKNFIQFNKKSFTNQGNFSFGIKELYRFPEINFQLDRNNLKKIYGLNININLNSMNYIESQLFLSLLGLPFKKNV